MMDIIDLPNNMEGFNVFTYSPGFTYSVTTVPNLLDELGYVYLLNIALLPKNVRFVSLKYNVKNYNVDTTRYEKDPTLEELEKVFFTLIR